MFDNLFRQIPRCLNVIIAPIWVFCFERVISGWRGALTVLDLRLKK
jgi:hypothetical protein